MTQIAACIHNKTNKSLLCNFRLKSKRVNAWQEDLRKGIIQAFRLLFPESTQGRNKAQTCSSYRAKNGILHRPQGSSMAMHKVLYVTNELMSKFRIYKVGKDELSSSNRYPQSQSSAGTDKMIVNHQSSFFPILRYIMHRVGQRP